MFVTAASSILRQHDVKRSQSSHISNTIQLQQFDGSRTDAGAEDDTGFQPDLRSSSSDTTTKVTVKSKNDEHKQTNDNHYGVPEDSKWLGRIRIAMKKREFGPALEQIHQNLNSQRSFIDDNEGPAPSGSGNGDTSILPMFLDYERKIFDELARQIESDTDCRKLAHALDIEDVVFEDLKQRFQRKCAASVRMGPSPSTMTTIDTDVQKHASTNTILQDEYGLRRLVLYHWFAKAHLLNGRECWDELTRALILCGFTDLAYVIGPKGAIEQNRIPEMLKMARSDDDVLTNFFKDVRS